MSLDPVQEGWQRRLQVSRFLAVGARWIVRVGLTQQEEAYDGGMRREAAWWALEIGGGEHVLFDSLAATLRSFERAELRDAIASAPDEFAQVVTVEAGVHRGCVVAPGSVAEKVFAEQGHPGTAPTLENDVLSFQLYEPGQPPRLWRIRASLDGGIVTRDAEAS